MLHAVNIGMGKISEFMGKDHDRLDATFEKFKNVGELSEAKSFFHEFKTGLQRHIVWEEEILFPLFESKTGMLGGPTEAMRHEHNEIKKFLEQIHGAVLSGRPDSINELGTGLFGVLKPHNDKEEGILYPWIDETLGDDKIKNVFARMESLPPGKYDKCCE